MRYDFHMYGSSRGMTLIDVLVGTAIALMVFLGIFGLLRASAVLSGAAANKAAALAIANGKLEQIRSLPYDSIGTVGGIPSGTLPQETTVMSDSVPFGVRTFISYYDDPKDGSGSSDSNGVMTDYKRVKITVSYETQIGPKEVSVISSFAPQGIETTTGGGTIRITVVDAVGAPVPGAEVTVVNASTTPAVNLTTFTDALGYALLPGAATSTGYRITTTKSGWSTAKTYSQDSQNQNPTPGHLTIAGGQTTTGTFAIDVLANIIARTFTPVTAASMSDTFASSASLASMSSTAVSSGALMLANAGGYAPSGNAVSSSTTPTYLVAWHDASFALSTPANTAAVVKVVDASGTPLPDTVLSGNSAGFTSSPINLSTVATSTYPSLALRAELSTTATTTSPSVLDWALSYSRGPVPLPNISFSLLGAKTIGSTVSGTPVYKTAIASATDSSGTQTLPLEWDTYALTLSGGYTLIDACPAFPYEVLPGVNANADITLATTPGEALRVYAKNVDDEPIPGASVTISRTGFSRTLLANACGFAYFSGLSATTYAVTANGGGLSDSAPSVAVSGLTTHNAILE